MISKNSKIAIVLSSLIFSSVLNASSYDDGKIISDSTTVNVCSSNVNVEDDQTDDQVQSDEVVDDGVIDDADVVTDDEVSDVQEVEDSYSSPSSYSQEDIESLPDAEVVEEGDSDMNSGNIRSGSSVVKTNNCNVQIDDSEIIVKDDYQPREAPNDYVNTQSRVANTIAVAPQREEINSIPQPKRVIKEAPRPRREEFKRVRNYEDKTTVLNSSYADFGGEYLKRDDDNGYGVRLALGKNYSIDDGTFSFGPNLEVYGGKIDDGFIAKQGSVKRNKAGSATGATGATGLGSVLNSSSSNGSSKSNYYGVEFTPRLTLNINDSVSTYIKAGANLTRIEGRKTMKGLAYGGGLKVNVDPSSGSYISAGYTVLEDKDKTDSIDKMSSFNISFGRNF